MPWSLGAVGRVPRRARAPAAIVNLRKGKKPATLSPVLRISRQTPQARPFEILP